MQRPQLSHRGSLGRSVLSILVVPLVAALAWLPVASRAHAAGPAPIRSRHVAASRPHTAAPATTRSRHVAASRVHTAATSTITGLHVAGNTIVNGSGQPVRLLGVDRSGTEYQCIHNNGIFDGPNDAASVQAIASWHTTAVRVPLNEDCWLGINGAPAAYSGTAYQQAIVAYVNLLNANGLVAILDLHWNAPGTGQATGQLQMPDADHAPAFWTSVATTFKGNNAVIFDLYNEPHDVSWPCWRDGGTCSGVGYAVAGMQSLVTVVRNTGATNVLMLGGLAYSNDLSQWLAYKPNDPLGNLAASWHVYNFNACNNTGCYDSQVAPVAQQVPLVAGEIGENDCGHGFIDTLMAWLDAHGGGYLGWAWDTFDCGGFPALISSYDGTPTAFGIGFRDHLAALASSGTPTVTPVPSTPTATSAPATQVPATATPRAGNSPTPTSAPPSTATATSRPATPTATTPPAATATATPVPATATATPVPATATPTSASSGGGVTVTGNVTGNSGPWWGEEDVTLSNSAPLTALRITVTVQKTPGVGYAGQYNSYWGGALSMGHTDTGSAIVYTYTLNPGQTVAPGANYVVGSQHNGNGTPHPTSGDTYAVTFMAGGVTTTTLGHF